VPEYFASAASHLPLLVESLHRRGYRVLGPTVREGELKLEELAAATQLPVGWVDCQAPGSFDLKRTETPAYFACGVGQPSLKNYLFPAVVRLFEARREGAGWRLIPTFMEDGPPPAFLGIRACDLAGLAVQDRIFLKGRYVEPLYEKRRRRALIIAVHCTQSRETCFCASLGTGPRATAGFDLVLTEVLEGERHYFLIEVGSPEGAQILKEIPHSPAKPEEVAAGEALVVKAAQSQTRMLETHGLKDFLYDNFENPHWDRVAARCLSCGNCAAVCPTCFCHRLEDTLDLTGEVAERWRLLDVCFTVDHSYIHGGAIRPSVRARYRQWLTHKLATWVDQFGCLGCVGCGRCITWCPVGIDLTAEVQALKETAAGGK
jgi:sulfhydrogenase subunit beta (sulfur reductase)